MTRFRFARSGMWIVGLVALSLLPSACGSGRKKYLQQVMPYVEKNDEIDSRVAKLPKVNAYKDPDYLQKLDSYITAKQTLLNQLQFVEPPFIMATTHNKLQIAMRNGIRYLQSEREKFLIAAEKMAKAPQPGASARGREEDDVIKQYYSQTAAYQADVKEQLMKQQYERLYEEVKDELRRAQGI